MARIRTIKPSFWKHEDLSELPEATHMLAAALLNYSDDDGYFNANAGLVKAECCPLREPSVSVPDSLKHLSRVGFIRLGTGKDGKRYGHVVSFAEHQRVNRPIPSKIKDMEIRWDDSVSAHTQITESSLLEEEGKGNKEREGKGMESADALARAMYPVEAMVEAFNTVAERIPLALCAKITDQRRRALMKIPIAEWDEALRKMEASSFCRGANGKWRASIDFLLQPSSRLKLLEGTYDDHGNASPTKFDAMLAGVLAAAGGSDAGEAVEPLPAGSQITGSLENADGRLLGAPEPLSGRRH